MRLSLTALALLTALLGACSSTKDVSAGKSLPATGPLKVAPELIGTPTSAQPAGK